jgi:hypothetical protein
VIYTEKFNRKRRMVELKTRTIKERITEAERRFVCHGQGTKAAHPMMAIGNQGTGVGSVIKGYNRRGGK